MPRIRRCPFRTRRLTNQGQRQLNVCPDKDFEHELGLPSASASFHDAASFAGMLLEQRERETVEPGEVFTCVDIANA